MVDIIFKISQSRILNVMSTIRIIQYSYLNPILEDCSSKDKKISKRYLITISLVTPIFSLIRSLEYVFAQQMDILLWVNSRGCYYLKAEVGHYITS